MAKIVIEKTAAMRAGYAFSVTLTRYNDADEIVEVLQQDRRDDVGGDSGEFEIAATELCAIISGCSVVADDDLDNDGLDAVNFDLDSEDWF